MSTELNSEERQQVRNLLGEFQDIFMAPDGKLGQTHLPEHFIDTGDRRPFNYLAIAFLCSEKVSPIYN